VAKLLHFILVDVTVQAAHPPIGRAMTISRTKNRCTNPNFFIDAPSPGSTGGNAFAEICDRSKIKREIENVEYLPGELQHSCHYWIRSILFTMALAQRIHCFQAKLSGAACLLLCPCFHSRWTHLYRRFSLKGGMTGGETEGIQVMPCQLPSLTPGETISSDRCSFAHHWRDLGCVHMIRHLARRHAHYFVDPATRSASGILRRVALE